MSTVVVLGAGGFLAGHIQRHFTDLGWRVVAIGREPGAEPAADCHAWTLPHAEFASLLAAEQPRLCVNAAGRASVAASMVEPLADFEANVGLNARVLDDIRRRSPRTAYIQLSSAAVYGQPTRLPVDEGAAIAPISPYGWHKRLAELVLEEHAVQFGLRTASLRIFSAYGARLRRQVVWDLARRAMADPARPLIVHGDPADSRDFIHGSDVARAVETLAERAPMNGECYNLAAGVETPISGLAGAILKLLGRPGEARFDSVSQPGYPSRWHADCRKLAALGFTAKVSLDQGLREVLAEAGAGALQAH